MLQVQPSELVLVNKQEGGTENIPVGTATCGSRTVVAEEGSIAGRHQRAKGEWGNEQDSLR